MRRRYEALNKLDQVAADMEWYFSEDKPILRVLKLGVMVLYRISEVQ